MPTRNTVVLEQIVKALGDKAPQDALAMLEADFHDQLLMVVGDTAHVADFAEPFGGIGIEGNPTCHGVRQMFDLPFPAFGTLRIDLAEADRPSFPVGTDELDRAIPVGVFRYRSHDRIPFRIYEVWSIPDATQSRQVGRERTQSGKPRGGSRKRLSDGVSSRENSSCERTGVSALSALSAEWPSAVDAMEFCV